MRLTPKDIRKALIPSRCDGKPTLTELKQLEIDRYNKLADLEDIEEEFGVDFIFLNKICKNGIYCYKRSIKDFNANGKRLGHIIRIPNYDIHIQFFGCYRKKRMGVSITVCIDYVYHSLSLNEYGKTWALTMEELKQ